MSEHFAMKLLSLIVLLAGVVFAQSTPPRKDIPAIARAANGSIVSVVMSDKEGKPIAQGSGFLVSKDGVIVTNFHVISEGSSAVVSLPDGAFYVVDGVLAFDKARDVAIIKAHGGNFRTLTLGNSDQLQVGEEVVAIGNPLSLESTVSNGIVSGIRTAEEEDGKFLQVTAPISPGSSGGPLFNMAGEVVGITTLYLKGGENLNFAIPINDAKRLLQIKSSKIQALPNETEPIKAQTHDGDARSQSSPSDRDYYRQINDAGGFSFKLADGTPVEGFRACCEEYVCFSDNVHSGMFFTFIARAYDEVAGNALDKNLELLIDSGGVDDLTYDKLLKEQMFIYHYQMRDMPYGHFYYTSEFNREKPDFKEIILKRFLTKSVWIKGVKVNRVIYWWDKDTRSWVSQIYDDTTPPRITKILQLSIEPTTLRYVEIVKTPIGDTSATDTYGVCEEIEVRPSVNKPTW